MNTRDSAAKAMQKAKDYMLGKDAKKTRGFTEIADSEDDDLSNTSPTTLRTRNDEHVARQLQEDLDREAAEAYVSESDDEAVPEQDEMDEDSEDLPLANSKGKGKSVATRPRPRGRAGAKSMVLDSENDEEDYSDPVDFEPPSKKRKTAASKGQTTRGAKGKGKARMPPPPSPGSDDDVEDVDILGK